MNRQILTLSLIAACAVSAQEPLALPDAVRQSLGRHPSIEAAASKILAAQARIDQARSGWLPRASYQESFQSGNNPVYVFGALLTQRQFTEANFAINKLNRPDALNNFQSQVVVDQTVWDFGMTKNMVRAAELGRKMTEEERKKLEMQLVAGVARAYHGVTLAEQALEVAREALKSAESDLKRAENLRAAGMATDSDVLSVRVHVAAVKEQEIRRRADLEVARAALNEALGLPLNSQHALTTPLTAPAAAPDPALDFEARAVQSRPEIAQAQLAREAAQAQEASARSQLLPQIGLRGIFEADRQNFVTKGGGNWMFAASLRWNLFDGNRTRSAAAEARHMKDAAAAGVKQLDNAIRLEVRKAKADAVAARERVAVTEATVAQAEESLRIIRNRYSSGLATISDLLRAETALTEAKTRRLAALYDQRMSAIALELAAGTLNGDSDVLK
jgi:outer membrane protein TolC